MVTEGYLGLQGIKRGNQGVIVVYKELQVVRGNYRELQWVKGGYRGLHGVTRATKG